MKKIAVLTSGGDSPAMNAALRAITLSCGYHQLQCVGFYHGYNGLIDDQHVDMQNLNINSALQHGGTILKSARCHSMLSNEGVMQACNTLRKHDIDALIVIGGDGSLKGLQAIKQHWERQVIGLPGTIDNDLNGTDNTIGFSTAVTTATHAIDKIRDTANAFERVFIVEVMGRHSGHIAFNVGIATGAEAIISFENFSKDQANIKVNEILKAIEKQASTHGSFLIILAENLWPGGAQALKESLNKQGQLNSAMCILGHIQRGGSPTPEDRNLATELGLASVDAILNSKDNIMIGKCSGTVVETTLNDVINTPKQLNTGWVNAHQEQLTYYLK
ncbi:ATP-dependent 6-phosphofructokinase 1 [Pseudoalteromonas holothuriae]|uniref:6-phosphofructokinase n=1 Tax=Pseudoalteromonas holothuriae TaxID=2963714 RepID=A0ABN8UP37_9GAMM|nr:ATP-dependent 6-phosphofructokinase [Pseudoalteromonas sp. CIP111951]CAH9064280.1 ATP-dependent 6-phosphofructokinase 1 [Pseudoalteromonas sp. CIP111951]